MASKYWLKLYHEMLDDPKVMQLRPSLRWRFVETLLVAGEMDEDGYLPDLKKYAWRVRDNPELVESELMELADAGLLSRDDTRWLVTRFAERQGPVDDAERMRQMRKRRKKQEYYGEETEALPNRYDDVTERNTEEKRREKEEREWTPTPFSELSTAFVNITQIPELSGGAPKWNDAIQEMVKRNITAEDLRTAYDEVSDTYSIVGPWSLLTPATIAMSRRTKKSKTARQDLEGKGYEFRS